jgi:hypothetical protein
MLVNHIPQIGTDWQLTRCNARADSASRTRSHSSKLRCASKSWSSMFARPTANWSPWFCPHTHTIFSSKWPIRWYCECGQHHWQMPLCSEEMEQGVLVVGSWTEPQNRGIRRGFCCRWRKNLGLRKAEAKESKAVRAPPEHVTWKVFPLRTDVFWKQSRRLGGWLLDMSHRAGKYNGNLAVGGVRISVSKGREQRSTHPANARQVKNVRFAQKSHVLEAVQQGVWNAGC